MADGKDTPLGYLRRTGPASAELFDKSSGTVYAFNFAVWADEQSWLSDRDGREIADWIFEVGEQDPTE